MTQVYHSNATTNQHQRKIIQQSSCANTELEKSFDINIKTLAKHKVRAPCDAIEEWFKIEPNSFKFTDKYVSCYSPLNGMVQRGET